MIAASIGGLALTKKAAIFNTRKGIELFSEFFQTFEAKQIQEKSESFDPYAFKPYDYQMNFLNSFEWALQVLMLAANQIGKSLGGSFGLACHISGNYPDWYVGVRFDFPPKVAIFGVDLAQTRDVMQSYIFGNYESSIKKCDGFAQSGERSFIPPGMTKDAKQALGVPGALKEIKVRHSSGGWTRVQFYAYSQRVLSFAGKVIDVAHIDEQCPTVTYGQIVTRTINGNKGKGGITQLSLTPENGMDEVLEQFLNDELRGARQAVIKAGWDDCPHIIDVPGKLEQMIEQTPEHELDMRRFGIPSFTGSIVYPVSDKQIIVEAFELPDHFARLTIVDLGWNHFAIVQIAHDRETDTMYVYRGEILSKKDVTEQIAYLANLPEKNLILFPHDAAHTQKANGEKLLDLYIAEMQRSEIDLDWHDELYGGPGTVEPGIQLTLARFKTDRLKILDVAETKDLRAERRNYRRNDKDGKPIKKNDHTMDAMRMGVDSPEIFRLPIEASTTSRGNI